MKVQLTVVVDYDPRGYTNEEMALAVARCTLENMVNDAIDQGSGLYGDTSLRVNTWDVATKRLCDCQGCVGRVEA